MRDFILYLHGQVALGVLLLVTLKLLAMHGLPLSYNENQRDFTTILPNKGNANEINDEISEIEPLNTINRACHVETKKKIRLSRSTYKVNSCIDFRPYQESFKKFKTYINQFSRDLRSPEYVGALVNIHRIR